MFTRGDGLVIIPFWLTAMIWVVAHDVAPSWTAQDPPSLKVTEWLRTEGQQRQYGLYDAGGTRIGKLWTVFLFEAADGGRQEAPIRRDDLLLVESLGKALGPAGTAVTPLGVRVSSTYRADGLLDEFDLRLRCPATAAHLHGERFHADFSFTFESGAWFTTAKVPLTEAGMISDALNPFTQLCDLRVGQRWRMQVFNPVAAVLGMGERFTPMLVEVVGRETITTSTGERRSYLVVEAPGVKAWVSERGVVEVQEVALPLVGKIRIVREPFDESTQEAAQVRWRDLRSGSRPED
ncbi:MAG TPA: hypothetical protein PKK06_11170 [Phycisphaerae bacterium]|nr:hypothetical protein [Phycisphaerae bacterium]HNU45800.1 hypothetical protein [Phycisphaerae bacterium]